VVEVGEGRGVITLPDDERLHNHVASQHAGALFSAGEAASGAAFMGAFVEHLGNITPLARSADISYLKLAKGPITATGTLQGEKAQLLSALDADGKVEFPVKVELADAEGKTVAEMTVNWHVRKNT
jgi:acyl-coenzyme A thioesterase PaaI-like protein